MNNQKSNAAEISLHENPGTALVASTAWFGGGRVPKTPGWEKCSMRGLGGRCRKWVNWSTMCWVTIWRGEPGCHVGYAGEYEGLKEGMSAAEGVEYCRKRWEESVAKN